MDKKTLELENGYLKNTISVIEKNKLRNCAKIKENEQNIWKFKVFFTDNFYYIKKDDELDELANLNTQIETLENLNTRLAKDNLKLDKQRKSPYFGRFDFLEDGTSEPSVQYVGLGLIQDEKNRNLVLDWRADICSLYYDQTLGRTSYQTQEGKITGNLTQKRQFRIENGKLVFYIDSGLVIDDDILMQELSKNSTAKMHEIASTIQTEQNQLIRTSNFGNIIVQGVAGSGKTSIAMHRVSYLLYKFKDQLKTEDILVLSPTEQFSEYINDVLPSLGEEKSFTTTFTSMAKRLLGEEFETREDMLERVISEERKEDFENIAVKSSFEFLTELKNFLAVSAPNLFVPKNLVFGKIVISKEEISDIFFEKLKNLSIAKRIDILADFICEKFKVSASKNSDLHKRAKKILYNQFITCDLLKIYNLFLGSQELGEISSIGAYDVAPVLIIKEFIFGLKNSFEAKYVIIDEMQDYTPCHFHLFETIWGCGKLYLGDINQSIDRTLQPTYLSNLAKLTKAETVYLKKSYRSTMQISLFSQKILGKKIATNVNRNGEEVECVMCKDCASAIEKILSKIKSDQSIAIICKTKSEVKSLQKQNPVLKKFKMLSKGKTGKKVITTPAEAKGVEFDCVIVPFASAENYCTELDRNLLYVSSTRALHRLFFVSDKRPSKFLTKKTKSV